MSPGAAPVQSDAAASPSDMIVGASRHVVAAMGILLSRHYPVWAWAGGGMSPLQRLAYVNCVAYPLSFLLLTVHCALPALCLHTSKSTFPDDVSYYDGGLLITLVASVIASVALERELRWSRVALRAWWRDEKLWVVAGMSAGLAAVFQSVLRACTGIDVGVSTDATAASKRPAAEDEEATRGPSLIKSPS